MLQNEPLVAKLGVDAAKNGPRKGLKKCTLSKSPMAIRHDGEMGFVRGYLPNQNVLVASTVQKRFNLVYFEKYRWREPLAAKISLNTAEHDLPIFGLSPTCPRPHNGSEDVAKGRRTLVSCGFRSWMIKKRSSWSKPSICFARSIFRP